LLDFSKHHPDLGGQAAVGTAAGAEVKGQLDNVAGGFAVPSIPTTATSPWKVTLWTRSNGQPWQVDLNPLSYPSLATLPPGCGTC